MIDQVIEMLFAIYMVMLFVRIMGSWIPELQQYRLFHLIAYYTDPYLNFFRGLIPPLGMIDISPLFAFLFLYVIQWGVEQLVHLFI